jgi:GH35 family endo-1,4-beta-xylanase
MKLLRAATAAAMLSTLMVAISQTPAAAGTTLRAAAQTAGVKIGSAVSGKLLDPVTGETAYQQWAGAELNSLTTENDAKWKFIEPTQGGFSWDNTDRVVNFAEAHQQSVRGHTLVWHSELPDWVGQLNGTALRDALQNHITTVVGHYSGRVGVWDVVNEPLNDKGDLRTGASQNGFWGDQLGASYIADAFTWAHAADPQATLYLNEFGIEADSPKARGLYNLVKGLVDAHVPIQGIGFQTHKLETTRLSGLADVMRRFTALGLEVAITELDVRMPLPADAGKLDRQANVYGWATSACLAVPGCVSVTTWGFTDKHSWIPDNPLYDGWGAATLLDDQYAAKPAYQHVLQALSAGRPAADPVVAWRLDEPPGTVSSDATSSSARHLAIADPGTLGNEGRTPYLKAFKGNGSNAGAKSCSDFTGLVCPSAFRTDVSYTITAWINPSTSPADQVIATQRGAFRDAFTLGQRNGKYYFTIPTTDSPAGIDQTLESTAAVMPGQWIHLAVVWNNGWSHAQLFLNGVRDSVSPLWNDSADSWASTGQFSIGKGPADPEHPQGPDGRGFGGSISDLRVYQRAVPDAEVPSLATPIVGEWTFDGHTGDTSWFHRDAWARNDDPLSWTADRHGNADSALNHVTGAKPLDTRYGQPLHTDRSYSISVWVKPADADGDGRADGTSDQAVLAADGINISPFYLKLTRGSSRADDHWQFTMPITDAGGAQQTVTTSTSAVAVGLWTHLVVVWNKGWGHVQLYVNGNLEGTGPLTTSWEAPETGSLHIGGAALGNFIGSIDDLRLYQRTLTPSEIGNPDF